MNFIDSDLLVSELSDSSSVVISQIETLYGFQFHLSIDDQPVSLDWVPVSAASLSDFFLTYEYLFSESGCSFSVTYI